MRFDWADLDYLGISENDFRLALSQSEGADWHLSGLAVTPTTDFLDRDEPELLLAAPSDGPQ
jgi:hypothetical protein